jgi:ribonuclease HI
VRKGKDDGQPTDADELSEDDTDEPRSDREKAGGRACKQRGWWERGAIETCKNSAGMTAWVHPEFATVAQESLERLEQAWNCADEKDECEVRLEGLKRNYWIGSEVGRMGGYEFQGAVFGIDGSNHNGQMGAGCCRLGAPAADQTTRVGREEEGSSSNRPELGGVVLALRQADLDEDVLILCDNESVLKVIRKWVGQGGRASLAKAPDADILREILELLRARINAGRATFFFKVKSHRGEALNERADTLAEMGRERPEEEKRWDQRTDRMTFEVKQGDTSKQSAWTDSVRNAFRKQACQAKLREAYATAARNWADRVWYHHNQRWMRATGEGRAAARDGKFKDEVRSVLQHWNKRT